MLKRLRGLADNVHLPWTNNMAESRLASSVSRVISIRTPQFGYNQALPTTLRRPMGTVSQLRMQDDGEAALAPVIVIETLSGHSKMALLGGALWASLSGISQHA